MPKYEIIEYDTKSGKETGLSVTVEAVNKDEAATKTLMAAMKQGDPRACKGITGEIVYPKGSSGGLMWVIRMKATSVEEPWGRPLTSAGRPLPEPEPEAQPPKDQKLDLKKLSDIREFWSTEVRRKMPDQVDDACTILEFAREHIPLLVKEVFRLREKVKTRNMELMALLTQEGGKATIELDTLVSLNPNAQIVEWKDVSTGKWHMMIRQNEEVNR